MRLEGEVFTRKMASKHAESTLALKWVCALWDVK